jgi:two-component system LytT family sensor kinase
MSAHPILKSRQNLTIYLLIWLGIIAFYQLNLYLIGLQLKYAIADNLLINLFLPGLGISYWYSAKYISIENNPVIKIFLSHVFGGIFITALWLAIGYFLVTSIVGSNEIYTDFFLNILPWRIVIGILYYFLFTAFYYLIIYYSNYQERIILKPYFFIFNSLNSMSALTVINPEKARNMILKLADFLRYTLASNEKQQTTLSEELKNIRLYLEIEKIRFEDKFEFVENIQDECLNKKVPNMILQPLFENAIKHAVYEALDKVTLNLSARIVNDFLEVKVENNFDGISTSNSGTGIGLNNIKNRLELIYERKDLISIIKKDNLFSVSIYIPV